MSLPPSPHPTPTHEESISTNNNSEPMEEIHEHVLFTVLEKNDKYLQTNGIVIMKD